jgi:hypothetical protein
VCEPMVYDKLETLLSWPSTSTNFAGVSNVASDSNHAFWIATAAYIINTLSFD